MEAEIRDYIFIALKSIFASGSFAFGYYLGREAEIRIRHIKESEKRTSKESKLVQEVKSP